MCTPKIYELKMRIPLPILPSDEEWANLKEFPYTEGNQLEYKEELISAKKLLEIVCAFLNSNGGYLIIGIRDQDLAPIGLSSNISIKEIDGFFLKCDNIYHQGLIVTEEGNAIGLECVHVRLLTLADGRRFLIVKVVPEDDKRQIIQDGLQYFRLSASNQKLVKHRYQSEHDMNAYRGMVKTEQKRFQEEQHRQQIEAFELFQKELRNGFAKVHELEEEVSLTRKVLQDKILREKEDTETQLQKTKTTPFRILCSVLSFDCVISFA